MLEYYLSYSYQNSHKILSPMLLQIIIYEQIFLILY